MTARAAGRTAASTAALRRTAVIRRLRNVSEVRRRLDAESAFTAYARAYLDPALFPQAEFYEASLGERQALVMHAHGGLGPSTLTLGDAPLIGALLSLHPGPRQSFLTAEPRHVDVMLTRYNLWRPQTMLRLQLDRAAFTPPSTPDVRRLIEADASELNRLYAIEEEGLRYSGRQVIEGVYFGAHVRGRLVAAAGTHIYSRAEGVAVIGNVFTHPDFRGRGLGMAVTAAVAAKLLENAELVVLNVDPANRTARHIYERLGFRETGRLIEAMATRTDSMPLVAPLRRAIARWRAKTPGTEVVEL